MNYEGTSLYIAAFSGNNHKVERDRLTEGIRRLRANAETLAAEIPQFVPSLTDHSVRHMDALWERASLLTDGSVKFNPSEAFVLGGAILLHDLANAVAAFPNGLADLRGEQWNDLVHA